MRLKRGNRVLVGKVLAGKLAVAVRSPEGLVCGYVWAQVLCERLRFLERVLQTLLQTGLQRRRERDPKRQVKQKATIRLVQS